MITPIKSLLIKKRGGWQVGRREQYNQTHKIAKQKKLITMKLGCSIKFFFPLLFKVIASSSLSFLLYFLIFVFIDTIDLNS